MIPPGRAGGYVGEDEGPLLVYGERSSVGGAKHPAVSDV
jgi:hypothetical protein